MLKKTCKGFTLLELMIVVAIIGVLAAVAVPGFMAYIKNSKTSEAKTNLDAIKTGAIAWFEAEHHSPNGMVAITKQYPYHTNTKNDGVGTFPSEKTIGVKTNPTDKKVTQVLNSKVWSELNFSISAPFYYYYTYASVATEVTNDYNKNKEKEHPKSVFNAVASASLDAKCDSAFSIRGTADGVVGAAVEISKAGTCSVATVLQEAPKDDKLSKKKE